jgi:Rrf2 family nitric oxide-sensitive transcriptional repressor
MRDFPREGQGFADTGGRGGGRSLGLPMRFTRFTDNALRCLLCLGEHPDTQMTVADIASRMAISEDHLTKVVQRLAQRGYLQTTRGRNGGVRLARSPEDITVGAVVRDTEEDCALVPCFRSATECPIAATCRLPRLLDDALRAFFDVLDQRRLSDLLRNGAPSVSSDAHPFSRPLPIFGSSALDGPEHASTQRR